MPARSITSKIPLRARPQAELVADSLSRVGDKVIWLASDYYEALFDASPQLHGVLPHQMSEQTNMLGHALAHALANLRDPDGAAPMAQDAGLADRSARMPPRMRRTIVRTLVHALSLWHGPTWTKDHARAWNEGLLGVAPLLILDRVAPETDPGPSPSRRAATTPPGPARQSKLPDE
ncbi:hypothetical protein ROA7023_01630 [Roseisalinus antarcticus]|uniref:Globin family profile domain-containing protein n=2 Tax=Roseisalinus antarcticus TaxID=254357 RepID=A0A1Y5SIU2_9RHOB|nr:hypothetical protein ROA7023_01630 [Roseisalinus antarcticus]